MAVSGDRHTSALALQRNIVALGGCEVCDGAHRLGVMKGDRANNKVVSEIACLRQQSTMNRCAGESRFYGLARWSGVIAPTYPSLSAA